MFFVVENKLIKKRLVKFPDRGRFNNTVVSNLKPTDPRIQEFGIYEAEIPAFDANFEKIDFEFDGNAVVPSIKEVDNMTLIETAKQLYSYIKLKIDQLEKLDEFVPSVGPQKWNKLKSTLAIAKNDWKLNKKTVYKNLLKIKKIVDNEIKSLF